MTNTMPPSSASIEKPQIENTTTAKRERRMLGFDLHWWETAMLVSLAFAAFAALAVGAATTAVVVLQRQEVKDARDALERYKLSAGAEIERAKEGAANANVIAATANEHAEKARLDAENARLETAQIKEKLAWRELPEPAAKQLVRALSAHKGAAVQVQYVANDPEAFAFAYQFTRAFKAAGWEAGMFSVMHPSALLVGVFVAPHGAKPEVTNFVKAAFKVASIGFADDRWPPGGEVRGDVADARDGAIIIIGSKPRPELKP